MTQEQVSLIEKFENILSRGYYCSGVDVTNVYNDVFNKNLRPSNCSSCIAQRIRELIAAKKAFLKAQEALEKEQVDNASTEENNAAGEAENKPVKKAGRPKKS